MSRADKSWLYWLSIFLALCFVGCDRLLPSRYNQLVQDADNKATQGDFQRAINLYEALGIVRRKAGKQSSEILALPAARNYLVRDVVDILQGVPA